MKASVILGAVALGGAAVVSVSASRMPQTHYPKIVSDLADIRGSWTHLGDKRTVYFLPGPYVGTTEIVASSQQFYDRHDWKTIEKVGDQFRMKFSKGYAFQIGPSSTAGSPNLEKVWETCVVRIQQQSAKQLDIERDPASSDPCGWLTGNLKKG